MTKEFLRKYLKTGETTCLLNRTRANRKHSLKQTGRGKPSKPGLSWVIYILQCFGGSYGQILIKSLEVLVHRLKKGESGYSSSINGTSFEQASVSLRNSTIIGYERSSLTSSRLQFYIPNLYSVPLQKKIFSLIQMERVILQQREITILSPLAFKTWIDLDLQHQASQLPRAITVPVGPKLSQVHLCVL